MGVPARAAHARAVPGGAGEPTMRPWDPTDPDLHLGHAAQRGRIRCGGWQRRLQRRHVPRAAHHRDAVEPFRRGGAQHLAHVRLALCFAQRRGLTAAADGSHGLGDGLECRLAVAAVLDDVLPPAFRIRVASSGRERTERVGLRWHRQFQRVVAHVDQRVRQREIHRPHRDTVTLRPGERLPLRAEDGEGQERGSLGRVDDVAEQCHRRLELLVPHPLQRARSQSAGSSTSTTFGWNRSRARTTDLAEPGPWCRTPSSLTSLTAPGRPRRSRPSRDGRARRPRGTHATPRRRGRDPSRLRP